MSNGIPPPLDEDDGDVAWALTTAQVQWSRGSFADAIVWLRRAVDAAIGVGHGERATELNGVAAKLTEQMLTDAGRRSVHDMSPPAPPPVVTDDVDDLLGSAPEASDAARGKTSTMDVSPAGEGEVRGPGDSTLVSSYAPDEVETARRMLDAKDAERAAARAERASVDVVVEDAMPGSRAPVPPPPPSAAIQSNPFLQHDEVVESRDIFSEPPSAEPDDADDVVTSVDMTAFAPPAGAPRAPRAKGSAPPPPRALRPPPAPPRPPPRPGRAPVASRPPEIEEPALPPPPPPAATDAEAQHVARDAIAEERATPVPGSEEPELETPVPASHPPSAPASPRAPRAADGKDERATPVPASEPPPGPSVARPEVERAVPAPPEPPAPEPEPVAEPTAEPEPVAAEPEPVVAEPVVGGIRLDEVRGFEDLPEEAQLLLAHSAVLQTISTDEEISGFEVALVVEGWVTVMPAVDDVAAAVVQPGQVVFTTGTLDDEGVALRVVAGQDGTVVAVWARDAYQGATADCPWVADELKEVADRFQALAGATMGPLGERLDDSLRGMVTEKLQSRTFRSGDAIIEAGTQVQAMHVVGAGRVEIVGPDGAVGAELGPGDFLFSGEVLAHGPAPATARAGPGGAVMLIGHGVTQELLVSVPPLLEILAF